MSRQCQDNVKVMSRYRRAYNCFVFYPEPAVASRSGEKYQLKLVC